MTTASRKTGAEITELSPVEQKSGTEQVFENGSLISVFIKPFEQFSEFDGIQPSNADAPDVKMKLDW